jgi:Uma2 family endonuclease
VERKIRHGMGAIPELIAAPLSHAELGERYRALCDDPLYANVPGKIELDTWGRMVMSPASNYHSALQTRLCLRCAVLGGQTFVEASVLTAAGVLVADVAWASEEFMRMHRFQTPFANAPELCIEVVSPSNSVKELREKIGAYLDAGAREVWIVYPQSKRFEFHGRSGPLAASRFPLDLSALFE